MHKTITTNIAGFIFNVEEHAFKILSEYLESIKAYFPIEEERLEIMLDIESRIAELFQERLSLSKEVVNMNDVNEVIQIMGAPEDYQTDTEDDDEMESSTATSKRMYRDPDNAKVLGVCSGLAAYFGWDPVFVRVIFVVAAIAGGSGFLAYMILFLVIPEARTTSEKLRMRGEKVNVENIKQHFEESKEQVRKQGSKAKTAFKSSMEKGARKGSEIVQIITKIVGFALIAFGITMTIILFTLFFGDSGLIPIWDTDSSISLGEFETLIFGSAFQGNLATIGLLIVLGIPILGSIFSGLKLLFNLKTNVKAISIAAACVWILGALLCVVTGVQIALQFQESGTVEYSYEVPNSDADTLYIDVAKDIHFSDHISYENGKSLELIQVDNDVFHVGYPELRIVQSATDTVFSVEISKEAMGKTQKDALLRAEKFSYLIESDSSSITLDPYFSAYTEDKWRDQQITITILVPVGKTVHLGKNLDRIMYDVANQHKMHDSKMVDKFWTMEEKGLVCLGCQHQKPYKSHRLR